jgi:outer membrane protein OmpA-like peptidoglycan-associated protein
MKAWIAVGFWALAGLQMGCHPIAAQRNHRELTPAPAADVLVNAFDRFPLVAFSEPRHGASGTAALLRSLIRHPRFAGTVNDVVVEFGNARYQDIADRYVAGEQIPRERLKQIWENTTVVTGVWTAPVYEGFLAEVRALNATLPRTRHVRVVLGDPPIDWSVVRGPADEDMNDWRDAHFAWAIEQHVMKKGRRALIWIGGAHISRRVLFPDSLIHLLDRRFPDQTLVALSIDREDVERQVLERLGSWPSLSAAPLRDTWLGRLDSGAVSWRLSSDTVEQNADVAVFWEYPARGPDEAPRVDLASAAGAELQRRRRLSESTTAFRGGKIRFTADAAVFTADSEPALHAVLQEMRRDRQLTLLVKAFADAREANGIQLSSERARAVVAWLVRRGIAADRLEPRGCGSSRALWIGHTEQQRGANRKAELVRRSDRAGCEPPVSFDFR